MVPSNILRSQLRANRHMLCMDQFSCPISQMLLLRLDGNNVFYHTRTIAITGIFTIDIKTTSTTITLLTRSRPLLYVRIYQTLRLS